MAVTFGLDISHHQDLGLDLARCRREGVEFVFLKATEGSSFVDPEFAANLAEARAAGLLIGAYCFVRSGVSAAAHVAKIRQVVPQNIPIIPDVETAANGTKPSLALTRDVVAALRVAGYAVPLSYIPKWYWDGAWGRPSLAGLPPLWSSRYPDNVVGTVPDEWADVPASYWDGYGGLSVAVLQFTSSSRIAGYQPIDANAFRGTRAQLAAFLGGGEVDMEWTDTFPYKHPDGVTRNIEYGKAIQSLWAEKHYGSVNVPWAGPSGRAIDLALYNRPVAEVDVPALAGAIGEEMLARGIGGATPDQVDEAVRAAFARAGQPKETPA